MLPEFSPRPWGTLDLAPIYPQHKFQEKIGEAWLTGDECRVANGPLAGKKIADLATRYGRELVGEAAPDAKLFPLLTKFLFPHDKLSVQVHPDDECARRVGEPWGKTECWYVLGAKPGAQVALGLKPGTTCSELEEAIRQNKAEDLLNWINVHTGEMIYVAAGTVHAISGGSILVETQQSSDMTYRLYDYGRPRELHLERGMEAVKERTRAGKVKDPQPAIAINAGHTELIAAQYFAVDKFRLTDSCSLHTAGEDHRSSVQILVALDGCGVVKSTSCDPVTFTRGDAVVVPACAGDFEVHAQWELEFLRARVPGHPYPEPATTI